TNSDSSSRLDVFLRHSLSLLSREEIRDLISSGQVLVNGHPRKRSSRVHTADRISVLARTSLLPNPTLPILVTHLDTTFVVLDKPAGTPSVALRYTQTDTVANFLTAHFPETAQAGPRPLEAGLVHRLDTETSGLLLAARTPDAYVALREQFRMRSV